MAQQIQVVLIDDLDGGPAVETLAFTVDGTSYEIDLSAANAARFKDAIAPFIGHARKASRAQGRRSRAGSRSNKSAEIRAWARKQGISVNERGRVPADLRSQVRVQPIVRCWRRYCTDGYGSTPSAPTLSEYTRADIRPWCTCVTYPIPLHRG